MQGEKKRELGRIEGGSPPGDPFSDGSDATGFTGTVDVTHGTFRESLPAGNMTVGEVRRRFRDRLDIHPEAVAILAGVRVGDDTRVRAGQLLMFVRQGGEKGGLLQGAA